MSNFPYMAIMHIVEDINGREMQWFSDRIHVWISQQQREVYYALGPFGTDPEASYGIFTQNVELGMIHLAFIGTRKSEQKKGYASSLLETLLHVNPTFKGLFCHAREKQVKFYENFALKRPVDIKIIRTGEFYSQMHNEPKYRIEITRRNLEVDEPKELDIFVPLRWNTTPDENGLIEK